MCFIIPHPPEKFEWLTLLQDCIWNTERCLSS